MFSSDGLLLSRSRDLERFRHSRLPQTQLRDFRSESQGFSLRPSVLDGVERGIAHRWIERYSLLLVVARDASTLRAQVAAQQGQMLVVAGAELLLVLLSFALLWRSLQQRRQTAIRLQDANEHLMQAQRMAQLGNWDYELASGSFNWSDETYRIFELERAATPPSYADALARFHPDDRDEADQAYSRALRRLEPYELTHRLLMSDGRVKWIHARGSVSLGEAGKPVRLVGTVQDISERKRDEAARAALTRERLLLLESTGEGIYGIDGEGRCSFINQSGAQMLGYRVDELIGCHIHEVTHHRHADGRQYPLDDCPVFLATVSGEPCRRDDEVFWRKDGNAVPVEYAAHPIRDGERVVGAVVTFADISRRKSAELELRIAEAAFQTQEGMFVTDESGTILRVNKAFTEITGYSAAEALGKNPRFRSAGRQDALFYAAMWERIKSSGAWKGEIWNRRKNGEIHPESVTITAVRGEDAGVTHYVATIHDISERKAAEERIRNLAFVDALTQLPNRRLLMERLNHALASSARSQSHAALMFIDLDNFKWLNDSHGHDVGDLLLREVAARLQACVREIDTVARLGGDEFVVMLESLSGNRNDAVQQASQVGTKILEALNEPYELDGLSHQSTASIGATVFSGQSETAEALLKQADIAMYKAKAGGRNALCVFEPAWLDGEEAPREA